MRYLHPDVLDNGHALIKTACATALLLPAFSSVSSYAQAVSDALASSVVGPNDFTISDEGSGRKIVFGGAISSPAESTSIFNDLHVAYTDGVSRILWVERIRPLPILEGLSYKLPVQTLISPQPQQV